MKTSTFIILAVVLPVIFIGTFSFLEMNHHHKGSQGVEVYRNEGCNNCHGADLQGTHAGPPLTSIKSAWKKNALIKFIKNPNHKIKRHSRIMKTDQNQNHLHIPHTNLTWKQTIALTDYLLDEK